MNKFEIYALKALRKFYSKFSHAPAKQLPGVERDPDRVSKMIYNLLMSDKPCMVARFGSTELTAIVNYLGVKAGPQPLLKYIRGKAKDWWWNPKIMNQMEQWSGFFPPTPKAIYRFCELMLHDMGEMDLLGSWLANEMQVEKYIIDASYVHLRLLEPFWSNTPWTRALYGKKVLVVHPFASLIERQYKEKRTLLFDNPDVLPEFELKTIKAVQSLGGENNGFKDWFEALDWMKTEMDNTDYDICLIGCGAYGFPLAAHAKRMGKKSIHLAGALQLLFGIRGKRWDDPMYGVKEWGIPYGAYSSLINDYWVRPGDAEKPLNADKVESSCYW